MDGIEDGELDTSISVDQLSLFRVQLPHELSCHLGRHGNSDGDVESNNSPHDSRAECCRVGDGTTIVASQDDTSIRVEAGDRVAGVINSRLEPLMSVDLLVQDYSKTVSSCCLA